MKETIPAILANREKINRGLSGSSTSLDDLFQREKIDDKAKLKNYIMPLINSLDDSMRLKAQIVLIALSSPDDLSFIESLLDEKPMVSVNTLGVLILYNQDHLINNLMKNPPIENLQQIFIYSQSVFGNGNVQYAINNLYNRDESISLASVWSLAHSRRVESISILEKYINNKRISNELRVTASTALLDALALKAYSKTNPNLPLIDTPPSEIQSGDTIQYILIIAVAVAFISIILVLSYQWHRHFSKSENKRK
jgi:hypothetical protein